MNRLFNKKKIIDDMASYNNMNKKVEIHHTKRGVLYAEPSQILKSNNAKKQIRALKKSSIFQKIRGKQDRKK